MDDFAFWFRYYVARMSACATDPSVSDKGFRQWMLEILTDLDDAAERELPLTPEKKAIAERLAQAMQAHVFHEGPDPDDLPEFHDVL